MGVPIIVVDRELPVDADKIYIEHEQAMDSLMSNLIALGHTRIGLVGASINRPGRDRLKAYRRAMNRAGITIDENLIRTEGVPKGLPTACPRRTIC